MRRWFAVALILLGSPAGADEPVRLLFNDRPPYKFINADGSIGGSTATAAERVFKAAGVSYAWEEMPAAREMALIERNGARACAVGFHRTPKREANSLFTRPIDLETPLVAIAPNSVPLPVGLSLDRLLATPELVIELKLSRSYGNVLDQKLATAKARTEATALNLKPIVEMVRAGRSIITFITEKEVNYYISQGVLQPGAFKVLTFPELVPGDELGLICSKSVGIDIVGRLDKAIEQLHLPAPAPKYSW